MRHFFQKITVFVFASFILFSPLFLLATTTPGANTNLIVCDPTGANGLGDCTFDSLVKLGINIMNFLIVISIPLAAISFVFAGFKLLTSAGNEKGMTDAKSIFTKTAIGLIVVLAAWLIVKTILLALLKDPSYSLLTF